MLGHFRYASAGLHGGMAASLIMMMITGVLTPNRHQAINSHCVDSTLIIMNNIMQHAHGAYARGIQSLKGYWHGLWNIKRCCRCVQVVLEIIVDTNNDSDSPRGPRTWNAKWKPRNGFWKTRQPLWRHNRNPFPACEMAERWIGWPRPECFLYFSTHGFWWNSTTSVKVRDVFGVNMVIFLHLIQVFIKSEDDVKTLVASHVWITAAEVHAWFCEVSALELCVTKYFFFLEISLWCPGDQNAVLL